MTSKSKLNGNNHTVEGFVNRFVSHTHCSSSNHCRKDKKNHGGGGGKGKWNDLDDGSTAFDDYPDDAPADEAADA